MKNKNATVANQSSANNHTANSSTKNIKAIRKLKVLIHILYNPQGVSEKSINSAANVMSGRNYPTYLQRKHDIALASPIIRLKDKEGSPYSVYQLLNAEQAHKLVNLIIHHCKRFKLTCPDEFGMRLLADNFPDRGEVAA
jgi:hypothetical protein